MLWVFGWTGATRFHAYGFSFLVATALVRVGDVKCEPHGTEWGLIGTLCKPGVLHASHFLISPLDVSSTPGDWMAVACRSGSFQNSTRKVGPSTRLSFWSWLRAHSISTAWFPTCSGSRTTKSRLGTQHQSGEIQRVNHRWDPSIYNDGLADPPPPSPTHRVHLLETDHEYLPFIKHVIAALHSENQEQPFRSQGWSWMRGNREPEVPSKGWKAILSILPPVRSWGEALCLCWDPSWPWVLLDGTEKRWVLSRSKNASLWVTKDVIIIWHRDTERNGQMIQKSAVS